MTTAETKPAATVTLKQIAADVAGRHGLTKRQVEAVLDDVVTEAIRHFKEGDNVRLTGLGTLYLKDDRPTKRALNVSTGEIIEMQGTKKLAFRPANGLNASLNGSELIVRIIQPAAASSEPLHLLGQNISDHRGKVGKPERLHDE